MADGTDEFEKVILSAGDNTFSFIGEAYNTDYYTNPFKWGVSEAAVLLPQQRIFENILRGPQSGVLIMKFGVTGILRSVYLEAPNASLIGSRRFNVQHNGVPLWAGDNRPLLFGSNPVEKTGLNIPGQKGDLLRLDLEQQSGGNLPPPLFWIVTIETQ